MEEAIMVKSLLDTDAEYVKVQAYIRGDDEILHIQGCGPVVNRGYGISANIELSEIDDNLKAWIGTIYHGYKSMANTDKHYFSCNMRYISSQNQLNFQIPYADDTHNTKYGGTFAVDADMHSDLITFWNRCTGADVPEMYQGDGQQDEEQTEQQPETIEMVVEVEN